jgi:hypothetical protein
MPVLEDIGLDEQILPDDTLHRIAATIDERLEILDDRCRKSPGHAAQSTEVNWMGKENLRLLTRRDAAACRTVGKLLTSRDSTMSG